MYSSGTIITPIYQMSKLRLRGLNNLLRFKETKLWSQNANQDILLPSSHF